MTRRVLFILFFYHLYCWAAFFDCFKQHKPTMQETLKEISHFQESNKAQDKILSLTHTAHRELARYIPNDNKFPGVEWKLSVMEPNDCIKIGESLLTSNLLRGDCAYKWHISPIKEGCAWVKLELFVHKQQYEIQEVKITVQE